MENNKTSEEIIDVIISHIKKNIIIDNNIEIMSCAMMGSVMWEIEGAPSDYDIMFIFKYTDPSIYIDITPYTTHIDKSNLKIDGVDRKVDIRGYDIRAFMKLLVKGSPQAFEFCNAPLYKPEKYNESINIKKLFKKIPIKLFLCSYYEMINSNIKTLKKKQGDVKLLTNIMREIYIISHIEKNIYNVSLTSQKMIEWYGKSDKVNELLIEKLCDEKKNGVLVTEFSDNIEKIKKKEILRITKTIHTTGKINYALDALKKIREYHSKDFDHVSKFLLRVIMNNE